jgi:hypothetical protein
MRMAAPLVRQAYHLFAALAVLFFLPLFLWRIQLPPLIGSTKMQLEPEVLNLYRWSVGRRLFSAIAYPTPNVQFCFLHLRPRSRIPQPIAATNSVTAL